MAIIMINITKYNVYCSGFSDYGLKYLFCIYCLMMLPFDLLPFIKGTVFAGSDELVEYNLPQDSLTVSNKTNKQIRFQLWKSDITPAKDEKDRKFSNELNLLIEQVRSIKIASQQPPENIVASETISIIEPDKVSIKISTPEKDTKKIESNPSLASITDTTLKILKGLIQNPEKINNPFETGEILFINGNLKEAALFYQEALIRTDPNAPGSPDDRAWLLFQKGNCLRNDEMAEAVKIYSQLIMEYPNSPWANMARIQSQFITWYQTEQPQKIIAENKQ